MDRWTNVRTPTRVLTTGALTGTVTVDVFKTLDGATRYVKAISDCKNGLYATILKQ